MTPEQADALVTGVTTYAAELADELGVDRADDFRVRLDVHLTPAVGVDHGRLVTLEAPPEPLTPAAAERLSEDGRTRFRVATDAEEDELRRLESTIEEGPDAR